MSAAISSPPPVDRAALADARARMRRFARTIAPEALVEEDLETGHLWGSPELLARLGYTEAELAGLTLPALLPPGVRPGEHPAPPARRGPHFLFPLRAKSGLISWWLGRVAEELHPVQWTRATFILESPSEGPEFDRVVLLAMLTQVDADALREVRDELDSIRSDISEIRDSDTEQSSQITRLQQQVSGLDRRVAKSGSASQSAATAALRAASTAQNVSSQITDLRRAMSDRDSEMSTEILRLIKSDATYEEQLKKFQVAFEAELSSAAKRAAGEATDSIREASNDAKKTISKRVAWPVGIIGSALVTIQYLLQHPEIIGKLVILLGG